MNSSNTSEFFVNLVVGNSTCGTCTAIIFDSIEQATETFFDIKKNGRHSTFLKPIKLNNMAGINFNSTESIDVFLDSADKTGAPLEDSEHTKILQPIINLGYEPIVI